MKHPSESFRSRSLFEHGCGYLVLSRYKADGRVEAGFFLLDVFCLGAKDAGFCEFRNAADFEENLLHRLFRDGEPVPMTPAAGRKLAEGAVAYARGLGFSPHSDFRTASRVFGGIRAADCDEKFPFGRDGKPFYIQGPSDSRERRGQILDALERNCGPDGYKYLVTEDTENFENFEHSAVAASGRD